METDETWKDPLPGGATLHVFSGTELIFSSSGKWLMPVFELEQFMETYTGARSELSAHDTAIGKAAAVMMIRLGITRIHANIASVLAQSYVEWFNSGHAGCRIELISDVTVPKLLCATEDQLAPMTDSDAMYRILRQRAKLVRGADVSVEHLSCRYSELHDFSFTLPAGGNLLIIGENGAGKTTLLRYLTGNIRPDRGFVRIGGKSPKNVPARTICYVPQQHDDDVFPLSVEEVVGLGIPRGERRSRQLVADAMRRTGCADLCGRSIASLSGGEKQKVAIARCLAQNAQVLLLDEPTSALDSNARAMVVGILKSLSVKEIPTIIIVTHDMELVHSLGWKSLRIGGVAA